MNILFDYQIFSIQKVGGISRYFIELMCRLPNFDVAYKNSVLFHSNEYLRAITSLGKSNNLSFPYFRGGHHIHRCLEQVNAIRLLRGSKVDIFHPTYYSPYFLKHRRCPYVITVHDMIHELFPQYFSKSDRTTEYKKRVILNADKIIAISENTKKDIIDIYGLPQDKIEVIYHGCNQVSIAQPIPNLPDNYILYVGDRGGYKNFTNLLNAFVIVRKEISDLKLICTGRAFTPEENNQLSNLGISNSVRHVFASDSQLNWLYQNAMCFIYPSLYEGFGLPILEAFSNKCPVVLSNSSCFPEIAKDGALYFDPLSISDIAEKVLDILNSSDLRKKLTTEGLRTISNYSWVTTVQKTISTYSSLL